MIHYRNGTALITGASSGIGKAFARALASRGMGVILVARSEQALHDLAGELSSQYRVAAEVIVADLSREGAAQQVYEQVQQRALSVDLLINNAGFGTHGPFEHLAPEREHAEVMLNVAAVVDLTRLFIGPMAEQQRGAVINVASVAGFQPTPYMAVYGATKAFVLSFSEALWAQYRKRGVRVLALCPGPVSTAFFDVVGTDDAAVGSRETPERVVEVALQALDRDRNYVIPGLRNYLMANASRFTPRGLTALISALALKPSK